MGGTCGTYEAEEKYKVYMGKTDGKGKRAFGSRYEMAVSY